MEAFLYAWTSNTITLRRKNIYNQFFCCSVRAFHKSNMNHSFFLFFVTQIFHFQAALKSVFPISSPVTSWFTKQKSRALAVFELDGLFHDKIRWHMLPLLPGISVTFYYISDPFSLQSSYQMASPKHIPCTCDVSPNVGIYKHMPNGLF